MAAGCPLILYIRLQRTKSSKITYYSIPRHIYVTPKYHMLVYPVYRPVIAGG